MSEHTIPSTLVQNIQNGRAAIIVGAGLGVPSWKQLLERMNQELADRGQAGDDAAAKDVEKLLHKGNLVRAAAFLSRRLGEDVCNRVTGEVWQTELSSAEQIPELPRVLATLPVRQIWTTFPGNLIETCMEACLPEGWPLPKVLTYKEASLLDARHRTLLKVLGGFDSYVATPNALRRAFSGADDLREFIRPFYSEGSLLFVGFRYGDPDLAALLDRLFGAFEPTESEHFLVSAGIGPVIEDELAAEHRIQVLHLPGKATDEEAGQALLDLLANLNEECIAQNISLVSTRPVADDLEGWLAVLHEDSADEEARAALSAIENKARQAHDIDRLIAVLMARIEVEETGPGRAALLREMAQVFETEVEDSSGAFTALTAALREDPAELTSVDSAERLAAEVDGWNELITDVAAVAGSIADDALAANYFERLGRWYREKLNHVDYAITSFREAIRKNPELLSAHRGLAEAFRTQQRWAELADTLEAQIPLVADADEKLDLYLSIGDLCESQLALTPRAVEAYQAATQLATDVEDAFVALERLFRQGEHWGKLSAVLEDKAEFLEQAGKQNQAEVVRRELNAMRSDKLGDLDGAITRYESELQSDAHNLEALQALLDLYDKSGRSDDYLNVLTALAEVSDQEERPALLRRLAMEVEDTRDGKERAVAALRQLVEIDPGADDAYRALERLYSESGDWESWVSMLTHQALAEANPAKASDGYVRVAEIYEVKLSDPHKAAEALEQAITLSPDHIPALAALGRMYSRTESWEAAVDTFVRCAQAQMANEDENAWDSWAKAGVIAFERLHDREAARRYLESSLAEKGDGLVALSTLAELHKSEGAWASAVNRMVEASQAQTNRLEEVALLLQAADICEIKLRDKPRGLTLLRQVLQIDPENLDAGLLLADRLISEQAWEEVVPVLEMVIRRTDPDDRIEVAQHSAQLGQIYLAQEQYECAQEHLSRAVELDPDNVEASMGLATALYFAAQAGDDVTLWERLDRRYRGILTRHHAALADGQVVEAWHRLGVCARALGDERKASAAWRRGLDRDPGHVPTLQALCELATKNEDWKTVVQTKRDLLDSLDEDARFVLLEEIGDLAREHLKEADTALGAYLEATKLRPKSRSLLHKTLDVFTQQKQWRQAVDILASLAETETDPTRRAKVHYTAAVICRDERKDVDLAVEFFTRVLDDDPTMEKAFKAIDALLSSKRDWKGLVRAHRKMLKAMGDDAPQELLLRLWVRLGEICVEHLNDRGSAIAAFEVAVSIDPNDTERREHLVNLYLEEEGRGADAIVHLQALVAKDPDRVELYKVLSEQYVAAGQLDKAYCVAQALVFLKAASTEETQLYEAHRPKSFVPAKHRLTEELWQKAIIHEQEDRHINAIFSSILAPVAATTAQPLSSFDVMGAENQAEDSSLTRMFHYANGVLGLSLKPKLFVDAAGKTGLRVANTVDNGALAPTLVAGSGYTGTNASKKREPEMAFELGKRMAYFRPERYLNYALQTLPKLEDAFYGALLASGSPVQSDHGQATAMSSQIKQTVPQTVLEQVGVVASKIRIDPDKGVIAGWRSATDLTANRVGFILCNDLQAAARSIATEKASSSTLQTKDRLRDLLAYAVSEEYFAVRKHLGIAVGA